MNALTMNTNLQSQQSQRRQQSESGQKKIISNNKESSTKSEESASDSNMVMQRKENNHNISVAIALDKKGALRFSNKKPISMAEPKKLDYVEGRDEEITRITTPHPNDVLCGRGGSINAHTGNVVFRGWIQERRESYNLADTKSAKTRITNEIFQRVRSLRPPGRFLHKAEAPTNDIHDDEEDYWTEVDDVKALAKISQALREGAPAFRAAHGKGRKSQRERTSQSRRNSVPASKKKVEHKRKIVSPKRCKTESPPIAAAYARSSMTDEVDISPPYYEDDAAETDLRLTVDNYDSLFNHNTLQSYRNAPFSSMGYQAAGHFGDAIDESNRFDQPRPLNSHPLVNMGDYHASISDVANAIPPTPPTQQKSNVASFPVPGSLPNIYAQVPASPYAMQYEQFDPYSFLSPVPGTSSGTVEPMQTQTLPSNNTQKIKARKTSPLKREHSLSFSDSELHDEVGDFTNPFEDEEVLNQASQLSTQDDRKPSRRLKAPTTIQMWELPYTAQNDPFPSPHVTPPARGLSFEAIGSIPSGHFLGSRKSSVASLSKDKVAGGSEQNDRNETQYSSSKQDKTGT